MHEKSIVSQTQHFLFPFLRFFWTVVCNSEKQRREKRYSFPNVQVNHPCFSLSFPWRTRFILLFDVSCFPTSLVVSLYVSRCCCQTRPLADSVFIQVGFFYFYSLLLSLLFFDLWLVSFLANSPFWLNISSLYMFANMYSWCIWCLGVFVVWGTEGMKIPIKMMTRIKMNRTRKRWWSEKHVLPSFPLRLWSFHWLISLRLFPYHILPSSFLVKSNWLTGTQKSIIKC